jgi:hypothetical protein
MGSALSQPLTLCVLGPSHCEPWPHPFGLAGLEGFLHYFTVTIRACHEYLDIEPNDQEQDM